MTAGNGSSVSQFGLIVALAEDVGGVNNRFGKTALQKLVYLAQEALGVPSAYQFTFYNHGPFSAELASDLTYLDWAGGVEVSFIGGGQSGYVIKPGPNAGRVRDASSEFVRSNRDAIDRVVTDFGKMTARDLELRATIVFVDRDYFHHGLELDIQSLTDQVKTLKPQFPPREISAAIEELMEKGYIRSRAITPMS